MQFSTNNIDLRLINIIISFLAFYVYEVFLIETLKVSAYSSMQ